MGWLNKDSQNNRVAASSAAELDKPEPVGKLQLIIALNGFTLPWECEGRRKKVSSEFIECNKNN